MKLNARSNVAIISTIVLFASNANAQGISPIILILGFYFALPFLVIGVLIWAVVWLIRGRKSSATVEFMHQRENEPSEGRLGE